MNKKEALWLPPGSVRAILAIGLVAATIALSVVHGAVPEGIMSLASGAVGFYFASSRSTNSSN